MELDPSTGATRRSDEVRDVSLLLPQPLHPVTFLRRVNRFVALTRLAGTSHEVYVHLSNSGRMSELLVPGALGLVHLEAAACAGQRRTGGTLLLVRHADRWVGVDARTPNRLFEAAAADPAFADAAGEAARAGVRLLAYTCRVTPQRIAVARRIPVEIGGET